MELIAIIMTDIMWIICANIQGYTNPYAPDLQRYTNDNTRYTKIYKPSTLAYIYIYIYV